MNKILVWDLPVRLFHWLLVLLVVVSYASAKVGGNAMQVHMLSGYSILALLLFRILWGFAGGTHARFASFLSAPGKAIRYLREMNKPESGRHLGHNPAGGWSAVLMLLVLLFQIGTGLFAHDDTSAKGPLAAWVTKATSDQFSDLHRLNVNFLYLLVGLHVAAILYYLGFKRENLVKPMITGYRQWPESSIRTGTTQGRNAVAAVLFAVCAVAVAVLVNLPKL